MFLLTSQIITNSHILAGIYFIFLEERPRPNLKGFSIPHLDLSEKMRNVVIK